MIVLMTRILGPESTVKPVKVTRLNLQPFIFNGRITKMEIERQTRKCNAAELKMQR